MLFMDLSSHRTFLVLLCCLCNNKWKIWSSSWQWSINGAVNKESFLNVGLQLNIGLQNWTKRTCPGSVCSSPLTDVAVNLQLLGSPPTSVLEVLNPCVCICGWRPRLQPALIRGRWRDSENAAEMKDCCQFTVWRWFKKGEANLRIHTNFICVCFQPV